MHPRHYFAILTTFLTCAVSQAHIAGSDRVLEASTTIEAHIEKDGVRVELVMNPRDIDNIGLLERRNLPEALADATPTNNVEDAGFRIYADYSELLTPIFVSMSELESDDDASINLNDTTRQLRSVYAEFKFPFTTQPETLTIKPPDQMDVGTINLVVYQDGLAINSAAYLRAPQVIRIDWNDPWKSRFENPAFSRDLDASMHLFFAVEPTHIRLDVLMRLSDLPLEATSRASASGTILPEQFPLIVSDIEENLKKEFELEADGELLRARARNVRLIQHTRTGITDIQADKPSSYDTVCIIATFIADMDSPPETCNLRWALRSKGTTEIPITIWNGSEWEKRALDSMGDSAIIKFVQDSREKHHAIPPAPERKQLHLALPYVLAVIPLWLIITLFRRKWFTPGMLVTFIILLGGGLLSGWAGPRFTVMDPFDKAALADEASAEKLTRDILSHCYASLNHPDERNQRQAASEWIHPKNIDNVLFALQGDFKYDDLDEQHLFSRLRFKDTNFLHTPTSLRIRADITCDLIVSNRSWGHEHTDVITRELTVDIRAFNDKWQVYMLEINDAE